MNLPLFELTIDDNEESGVDFIALVKSPAIELEWQAFNAEVKIIVCKNCGHSWDIADGGDKPYMCKCGTDNEEFIIEPKPNESSNDFMSRCIATEIDNGYSQEQAAAICYSKLNKDKFDSYSDYPEAAKENAKIALRYAEENGWGDCGTEVGKARANQLAKGEPISRDTIARMAAFERHRQNSQKELGDGCGRLMWLAWGGDAGVEWAQRKLKSIDKESKFAFKADKEKKIISGAAMIPNIPILRKREDGSLYNVFFKPETIEKIVERFFKHDYTKNFNKSHSSEIAEGVYLIESFIINSERGIMTPKGYDKVPDGTWWISCKVENEEIWQDFIKTGEFKGFSVEGIFKHSKSQDDEIIEALLELITN